MSPVKDSITASALATEGAEIKTARQSPGLPVYPIGRTISAAASRRIFFVKGFRSHRLCWTGLAGRPLSKASLCPRTPFVQDLRVEAALAERPIPAARNANHGSPHRESSLDRSAERQHRTIRAMRVASDRQGNQMWNAGKGSSPYSRTWSQVRASEQK
jgi:hypothetical protein